MRNLIECEQDKIKFANGVVFYLSHGSGIDCKWEFDTRGPKITAYNEFHTIDANGMYAGYIRFKVKFSRKGELLDVSYSKQDAKDICAGYERQKNEYGEIETNEPFVDDLDDYLYQTLDCFNEYWHEQEAKKTASVTKEA